VLVVIASVASAQKTEVGYDKEADFAQFKTYSWVPRQTQTTRPLLVANIMAAIDEQLQKKGLQKVESSPNLLVNAAGNIGIEGGFAAADPTYAAYGGFPPPNATVWTGTVSAAPNPLFGKGVLIVDLVNANQKQLVWRGTVKENLDPTKRSKALEQVNRAIAKLFSNYPPNKK
jgi:hypothetical protein